jgi:hypothetical protein
LPIAKVRKHTEQVAFESLICCFPVSQKTQNQKEKKADLKISHLFSLKKREKNRVTAVVYI